MILNCLKIRDKKIEEIKSKLEELKNEATYPSDKCPTLVIITSGLDESSEVYVNQKIKIGEQCGIKVIKHVVRSISGNECTTDDYTRAVQLYNRKKSVHGIIVQIPLPKWIDERAVLDTISPIKDVDCMTTENVGRLHLQNQLYEPCTPKGIMSIFKYLKVELTGRSVIILGRSNIVGRRMHELMVQADANVGVLHSKSSKKDLIARLTVCDIFISATGKPDTVTLNDLSIARKLVSEYNLKPTYQLFIDVGINRDENGKLIGDIDRKMYDDSLAHCTTVPGGVGPMTVVSLMENVVQAYEYRLKRHD